MQPALILSLTHARSFVTRELFDTTMLEVKVEDVGTCYFACLFYVRQFTFCWRLVDVQFLFLINMGLMPWLFAYKCCSYDSDGIKTKSPLVR